MNHPTATKGRREFLQKVGVGGAAAAFYASRTVFASEANSALELGIIGSGGRARFVGKKFVDTVGKEIRFVAAHDYFEDRLEAVQNMFNIEPGRSYTGLEGYREILASNVDGVIITTPPYFHPEQAAAAVAAGKHVWLAKPVGIDAPGCLSIKETGRRAQGKVAFLVDFQTRNSPFFVEAAKRVHAGDIGEIVSGEAFNQFPAAGYPAAEGMSGDKARLRRWGTDPIISGDCVVEQAVHAMDVVNWFLSGHPVRAFGTGGLKARQAGKNWDHFTITYWYENGAKVDLNCSQFMHGYEDLGARFYGSLGVADLHYRALDWGIGPVTIKGDHAWAGTDLDDTWDIGVENNCRDFVKAVRSGEYMNHAEDSANSTLAVILGRNAAYQEAILTWDDMLRENQKLDAKLSF